MKALADKSRLLHSYWQKSMIKGILVGAVSATLAVVGECG